MKNYSKNVTNTPQTQPMFGRTDMVKNNAGGYSFQITPQERLARFLLIGSEGGTYYVDEQKLTVENANAIVSLIKTDGKAVVETLVDFATNNKAPKADSTLFVLALATTFGDEETKTAAYAAISKVCRTSTHLFTFLSNVQNLRGWSRGLRNGVGKFYTTKNSDQLAYQLVKYRNRAGFTHRDALRLAHPSSTDKLVNTLFAYATGKATASETANPLVQAFEAAQAKPDTEVLVGLIQEFRLTWEMIPTDKLNEPAVLTALLENMPATALVRNLNRFSGAGMTKGNTATTKTIVKKLSDKEFIKKSGIHPVNVVNAMLTYSQGHGTLGNKTWEVNQNIVDALNDAFYTAIESLTPSGKDILIGVDISGSMQSPVNGMAMTASQIANVLAVTMLKSEKNAEMVWFDTSIKTAAFGRRTSLDEVLKHSPHGGGTDCAQPIVYALNNKRKYDAIVILTDNETWAGRSHGLEILNQYRKSVNKDVKVIEVAMVANGVSNLPNDDKNLLRVVGFDASVTEVIGTYLE